MKAFNRQRELSFGTVNTVVRHRVRLLPVAMLLVGLAVLLGCSGSQDTPRECRQIKY